MQHLFVHPETSISVIQYSLISMFTHYTLMTLSLLLFKTGGKTGPTAIVSAQKAHPVQNKILNPYLNLKDHDAT